MKTPNENKTERPPVVAIMGHIDHGKSTLLSYIRKSTKPLNEAGGITQHISAYEVIVFLQAKKNKPSDFLTRPDTSFFGIRSAERDAADIAVLVVSAEDGVKPQTSKLWFDFEIKHAVYRRDQ